MKNMLIAVVFFTTAINSWACDPCALFNASRLNGHEQNSFTLALSEQYTNFNRAKNFIENSAKNAQLVKNFSTTQVSLAYDVRKDLGVQIHLPIIYRRFTDIQNFRESSDSEFGIGDLSLTATYSLIDHFDDDLRFLWGITGGVKFPTGDTGTLDSLNQSDLLKHHTISPQASGGRALSLGTGSYDYILGSNLLTRYQKLIFLADLQYTIRTEGDFNYEFANDFVWSVGPGRYVFLEHNSSVALRLALVGEFKSKDKINKAIIKGSQISNLYIGPEIIATFNNNLFSLFALDFRVTGEDIGAQVVPENRLRFTLAYRF